jgi:hypothetical protein
MNYDYTTSRTVRDTNKHIKTITNKQFRAELTEPTFPQHRFITIDHYYYYYYYYYYSLLCGVFTATDLHLAMFLGYTVLQLFYIYSLCQSPVVLFPIFQVSLPVVFYMFNTCGIK